MHGRTTPCTALATLAGVLGLTLAAGAGETLRFQVEEGTRLAKTVTTNHELSVGEVGSTREGGPLMRDNVGGWITSGNRLVVLDDYLSVGEGRPLHFRRTFRNVEGHARVNITGSRGRIEERVNTQCPLKGQVVAFSWIEDEQEYARTYDHLIDDESLLIEVRGDMDLMALLPAGEVELGSAWALDPAAMRDVFAPGGNLSTTPVEAGYFPRIYEVGVGGDLADVLGPDLAGSARATLSGVRTEEGRRLAEVDLEFTLASERDRTRAYQEGMPGEERREASSLRRVLISWSFNGTGVLLWDLEGGHAASLRIEGHETVSAEVFKSSAVGAGEMMDISQRSTYSGQLNHRIAFRVAGDEDERVEKKRKKKKTGR